VTSRFALSGPTNLESTALDSIAVCFRVRQGQTQEGPTFAQSECCCQVDIEIVGDIESCLLLYRNRLSQLVKVLVRIEWNRIDVRKLKSVICALLVCL